ncbi:NAD-dependent epimerase/dehydratase family protein [Reinekea marinisedimentorum]|uniref:NAD-dependent epimerase/dehydratase family protein n=1 Tax=Reinekea marinisedimentorum TaxID=230495 RepID=UPI001A9E6311|nr:NAD-dependent epimerase/dehydratase family protein [Reinekea marinisedimentorum]
MSKTQRPVMVTGATGYVAGHLVKKLLQQGLTVHAAVRDPANTTKLKHLNELAEQLPGRIKYFKADLLHEGSYRQAMDGCELVFHTASPFVTKVKDAHKELIEPALSGTRNVLKQANQTPSVKRVVLTSSCAAICGDNADIDLAPGRILSESVWNETSSLNHNAYAYSKTLAEREAWKIYNAQARWQLVTINPSLVIGPAVNPYATSGSFDVVRQCGNGSLRFGAPRWGFGVVDVRDVAEAHYKAGFTAEAEGRYLISAHNTDMFELANSLMERYGAAYPIPKRVLPRWPLWLFGPMLNKGMSRKVVALNVNRPWRADNSKAVRELGIRYRPLQESMEALFQQMIDHGRFKGS